MANSTTYQVVERLCGHCPTNGAVVDTGDRPFQARRLDRMTTIAMRYGTFGMTQFMDNNMAVFHDNVIDGMEIEFGEWETADVQSRATGGRSKFECGFNPKSFGFKSTIRRANTEMLHDDKEYCAKKLIGSKWQDGQDGRNALLNTNSTIAAAQSTDLGLELMANSTDKMVIALDGTWMLGDWTGDGRGDINAGDYDNTQSLYPHHDGLIKMTLLQDRYTQLHSVDVTLPALVGGDAYFFGVNNQMVSAATAADLVAGINTYKINIDNKRPYTATLISATVIRITANFAEKKAYGRDAMLIKYSIDGTLAQCTAPLAATDVVSAMAYSEEPSLFDYQIVTEAGSWDYWRGVFKAMDNRIAELFRGQNPDLGTAWIAVDPLMFEDYDIHALYTKYCQCENPEAMRNHLLSRNPARFVPFERLRGTGLWFGSFTSNIHVLTNATNTQLSSMENWYDPNCQMLRMRNELLSGILVANYALCFTNAKGSFFEQNLNAPYQPENIPHINESQRPDAITVTGGGFEAYAEVCYTPVEGSDPAEYTLSMINHSVCVPEGAVYNWTVFYSNGTTTPILGDENPTLGIPVTDFETITMIQLEVVAGAITRTVIVPFSSINECC